MTATRRTRVFLACPGLGHVNRGFETFTRECYDALKDDDRLDLYLLKGAGQTLHRERTSWCIRRDRLAARWLGSKMRRDSYFTEQATFALGLFSQIALLRPDVIFFSDVVVGNWLWRWRRLCRAKFKLLVSNGGPIGPPDFPRFDHVHQVLSPYYAESARAGRPAGTQTLIPYGFYINPVFQPLDPVAKAALRAKLGLPVGRTVLLTVGAINQTHKRMDYVAREIATLPAPRPFLVMLGQWEQETSAVIAAATEALGPSGYVCRTVPAREIRDYYEAADVFALGSLKEGFGRVLVEALSHGLPCLAADQPFAREVLGTNGYFADFSRPGGLAQLLARVLAETALPERAAVRHAAAYDRLSWDRLRERYVDMIEQCHVARNRVAVGESTDN